MYSQAVIGLGFGDCGKGRVVDYLCSRHSDGIGRHPLVVRFSGGQQASHMVYLDEEKKHLFSNFGSGGLRGCDTYWSKLCTMDPIGIFNEMDAIENEGHKLPRLYIDRHSPVTTPYEKTHNLKHNEVTGHGSCGVGVGATWGREESMYSILAEDILHPKALAFKLELLQRFYGVREHPDHKLFLTVCRNLFHNIHIHIADGLPVFGETAFYDRWIFEGSQGLLLDQHYGFFPHVTRSNTGTQNIREIKGRGPDEIWLVTRAYQTRHGNGPMTNTDLEININNKWEHNKFGYQGDFRTTVLDLDLLKYAIEKDEGIRGKDTNLVVTCLDAIDTYRCTFEGKIYKYDDPKSFTRFIGGVLNIRGGLHMSQKPWGDLEGVA